MTEYDSDTSLHMMQIDTDMIGLVDLSEYHFHLKVDLPHLAT